VNQNNDTLVCSMCETVQFSFHFHFAAHTFQKWTSKLNKHRDHKIKIQNHVPFLCRAFWIHSNKLPCRSQIGLNSCQSLFHTFSEFHMNAKCQTVSHRLICLRRHDECSSSGTRHTTTTSATIQNAYQRICH